MKFKPTPQAKYLTFYHHRFKTFPDPSFIACPASTCKGQKILKIENKLFGRCKMCKYKAIFFNPTPIQRLVINLENSIINTSSGTGAGKTLANAYICFQHALDNPGTNIVISATDLKMIEQVAKKTLMDFFDDKSDFKVKNQTRWVLNNSTEIWFISPKSFSALKGRNLSLIWLVEAQSMSKEFYNEAQNRLRSSSAITRDGKGNILENRSQLILESNVLEGSYIKDIIGQSHTLIASDSVGKHSGVKSYLGKCKPVVSSIGNKYVKDIVSIIWTPLENPYLPESLIHEMVTGKDQNYTDKEFWAKWFSSDGQIYKDLNKWLIYSDQLPDYLNDKNWLFCEAADFAPSPQGDNVGYLLAIWNPTNGKLIVLDGFNKQMETAAQEVQAIRAIRKANGFCPKRSYFFVADPSGFNKDKAKGKGLYSVGSYAGQWINAGLNQLKPAFGSSSLSGSRNIKPGIRNVLEKFNNQQLKILSSARYLFEEEFEKYVMIPYDAKNPKNTGKPVDRYNHICDTLRYMVQNMPANSLMIEARVLDSYRESRYFNEKNKAKNEKYRKAKEKVKRNIFGVPV